MQQTVNINQLNQVSEACWREAARQLEQRTKELESIGFVLVGKNFFYKFHDEQELCIRAEVVQWLSEPDFRRYYGDMYECIDDMNAQLPLVQEDERKLKAYGKRLRGARCEEGFKTPFVAQRYAMLRKEIENITQRHGA